VSSCCAQRDQLESAAPSNCLAAAPLDAAEGPLGLALPLLAHRAWRATWCWQAPVRFGPAPFRCGGRWPSLGFELPTLRCEQARSGRLRGSRPHVELAGGATAAANWLTCASEFRDGPIDPTLKQEVFKVFGCLARHGARSRPLPRVCSFPREVGGAWMPLSMWVGGLRWLAAFALIRLI